MSNPALTILCFDYGRRRIGVAVGQTISRTATPLDSLAVHQRRPDWGAISALIDRWRPDLIVLGKPHHMDGSTHPLTPEIEKFANKLRGRYGVDVVLVDERLSSIEARRRLAGHPENRRSDPGTVDSHAAQVILETWFSERPAPKEPT